MKLLLILSAFILLCTYSYSSELNFVSRNDSLDIKNWTREDFIKEFGSKDSATALINLFFKKNTRGKVQTTLGGALLIGGVAALVVPPEPGDDQKGFGDLVRPAVEPAAAAIGAIFSTSGIIKVGKYTKQKLYLLLQNYKNGDPIPEKYKVKLKQKYFPRRILFTPKF